MDNVRILENGVESQVAVLAYLQINGKNYLFYSLNDFTENGLPKIRITATNNAENTINDEEWSNVKTVISNLANGVECPNVDYLPTTTEVYTIGQVKKLAVKTEVKQSFVDFVKSKYISHQAEVTAATGPVNEQMPFYDQTIDVNNTSDQLQDRTVVENAFDNSIKPPVPNAIITPDIPNQPIISAPVEENKIELTEVPTPTVEPAATPIVETAPTTVEPSITQTVDPTMIATVPVVNEPVKEINGGNNMNNDMFLKLKEIVETNMIVIENSIKNIRDALAVIDSNNGGVASEPVDENPVENPIIESTEITTPIIEPTTPVVEQSEPTMINTAVDTMSTMPVGSTVDEQPAFVPSSDIVEPSIGVSAMPEPAPAFEPVIPVPMAEPGVSPLTQIIETTPMIDTSVPNSSMVNEVIDQGNVAPDTGYINTAVPTQTMMPSDIPVIPSDGIIPSAPAPQPINNDFAGMSPTNMPVSEN